jgi:RNA recognition motif-containing protein
LVASTQTNDLFDDTDSVSSTTFVTPCAVNFEDISVHNLRNTILTAARYCLVDGYNNSRFYPDNFLRREELAKMTVNMMMLKLEGFVRDFDGIDYDPFVDVSSTNQLAPYMSYVSRLGVW